MHRDVINLYAPSLYRLHRKDNHRADLNLFGQKGQNPSWLGALQSSEWLVLEYNAYWDTAASPQFVLQRTLVRNREDQRYLWRQRVLCRPGQFTVHRLAEVDGSLPYLRRQVLCCVRDGRRRRKIEHTPDSGSVPVREVSSVWFCKHCKPWSHKVLLLPHLC